MRLFKCPGVLFPTQLLECPQAMAPVGSSDPTHADGTLVSRPDKRTYLCVADSQILLCPTWKFW